MCHLLVVLILGQQALSQDWVGQRVITRYGTALKIGRAVVDDEKRSQYLAASRIDRNEFRVYRVEIVNGPWLWLAAEKVSVEGWAKVEDVIPYDQAIDYITTVIRKKPSSNSYMSRGLVWSDKKEYDIAIGDYNEAIRLDPRNESAYYNRGIAWYDKKELDKALADYNEAIRLDPRNESAYTNRGIVWYDKKELDKALADYSEAIRLDPKYSTAYYDRGNAWKAKKELDKAAADYSEAIRLDPRSPWSYLSRGMVWKAKKELDKALADYSEGIRLDPKLSWPYHNRGVVWLAKQEFDKALSDFDEAIRLDPKFVAAYYNRTTVWEAKQEFDKALADYAEVIRIDAEFSHAYNGRAWLWATCPEAKFRDGAKAVESATRGCELTGWKIAYFLGTLAAAHAESGDFDKAVKWQQKAIELLPSDAEKARNDSNSRLELYQSKKPYRDEGKPVSS